jgi:hypothetical protein
MVFLALVANAAICGIVSSPNDRYQARVVWLANLILVLSMPGPCARAASVACRARAPGRRDAGAEVNRPAADVASHRSPA